MAAEVNEMDYILAEAKRLMAVSQYDAEAFFLAVRTICPNDFEVQFAAYKYQKSLGHVKDAANIFNYILATFQKYNIDVWEEATSIALSLHTAEQNVTAKEEFFLGLLSHLSPEAQRKIILTAINQKDNLLEQTKLLMRFLKRCPTKSPPVGHVTKLFEMMTDGAKQQPEIFLKMIVDEGIPLIEDTRVELSSSIVCRIYTCVVDYYIRDIVDNEKTDNTDEHFRCMFDILNFFSHMLKWNRFFLFNETWSYQIYWDKLIDVVSITSPGSTQVLFYATLLFIFSLHRYLRHCCPKVDSMETSYVLVEAFKEWHETEASKAMLEPPKISAFTTLSQDVTKAFINAAHCWQLLNTEPFQRDFSKLMVNLPLSSWISRFLFDLAIYFGQQEEAKNLLTDLPTIPKLDFYLHKLSLILLQGSLTLQGFECIMKIYNTLPNIKGQILEKMTMKVKRHMMFIPLTQMALVQYCTKALLNYLSIRLFEPNCPDHVLGDLLVLSQMEHPADSIIAEKIFELIANRRTFKYRLFTPYIISIDYLEEMLSIVNICGDDGNFDIFKSSSPQISSRRQSQRNTSDKCPTTREDLRIIIRQQMNRCNENICNLIVNFTIQEHARLMQYFVGVIVAPNRDKPTSEIANNISRMSPRPFHSPNICPVTPMDISGNPIVNRPGAVVGTDNGTIVSPVVNNEHLPENVVGQGGGRIVRPVVSVIAQGNPLITSNPPTVITPTASCPIIGPGGPTVIASRGAIVGIAATGIPPTGAIIAPDGSGIAITPVATIEARTACGPIVATNETTLRATGPTLIPASAYIGATNNSERTVVVGIAGPMPGGNGHIIGPGNAVVATGGNIVSSGGASVVVATGAVNAIVPPGSPIISTGVNVLPQTSVVVPLPPTAAPTTVITSTGAAGPC